MGKANTTIPMHILRLPLTWKVERDWNASIIRCSEMTTDTFDTFLKRTEAEYRIREDADREKIRQRLIMNKLNKKRPTFV